MSHKKSKNKQNYKGNKLNQQASHSAEDDLMSQNYQNNSNAHE